MAQGSGFAEIAGNIGAGLGDFIGGLTNPLLGGNVQTTTTVTQTPTQDKSNTVIIVAVVAGVIILGAVLYFVFKRS